MPLPNVPILYPEYYKKFTCIGSACEDHCCKGWDIVIDKNTYELYRGIKNPQFKASFSERIKRVKGEKATDTHYAKFILTQDNICKFFRDDGLCELHATYGERYLSFTCKSYPRKCNMLQKNLRELSLVTSCPEVIRIALFTQEPLSFALEETSMEASNFLLRFASVANLKNGKSAWLEGQAFLIRSGCIDILQCRSMSLPDRLLAIGMMLSSINRADRETADEKVAALLGTYMAAAQNGRLDHVLEKAAEKKDVAASVESLLFHAALQLAEHMRNKQAYQPMSDIIKEFSDQEGELALEALHARFEKLAA